MKTQTKPTKASLLFFGWFSIFSGLLFFYLGGKGLYYAQTSKTWSNTKGVLLASSFEPSKGFQGVLKLQYQYTVEEGQHIGSSYLSGDNNLISISEGRAFEKCCKPGSTVTVFYNPKLHGESCLVTGRFTFDHIGLTCMGVIGFIMGIVLFRESKTTPA